MSNPRNPSNPNILYSLFELIILIAAIRSIPRTRSVHPSKVRVGDRILFNFLGTGPYLSAPDRGT